MTAPTLRPTARPLVHEKAPVCDTQLRLRTTGDVQAPTAPAYPPLPARRMATACAWCGDPACGVMVDDLLRVPVALCAGCMRVQTERSLRGLRNTTRGYAGWVWGIAA